MSDYKYFHHITAHRYTYPGWWKVLILDGNLENQRDVCSATEAGYIKYTNLPGTIKTGCQISLCATSKFCYHHAPRISRSAEGDSTPCPEENQTQIITAVW